MVNKKLLFSLTSVFILTRLAVLIPVYAMFYSTYATGKPPAPDYYLRFADVLVNYHFVNALYFYDAVHYVQIVLHGYDNAILTMWFPLYPIFIKLFMLFIGTEHIETAAVLISNVAYAAAFYVFFLLERDRIGDTDKALFSCAVFGLFPGSVYFSSGYAESTMLLFVLLSLYYLRKPRTNRNVAMSGVMAGLSAVARISGFLLPLAVFLENFKSFTLRKKTIYAAVSSIPLLFLLVYFQLRFHNPFIFKHMEYIVFDRFPAPMYKVLASEFLYTFRKSSYWFWLGIANIGAVLFTTLSIIDKDTWVPRLYVVLSLLLLLNNGIFSGWLDPMYGMFRYCLLIPTIYTFTANFALKNSESGIKNRVTLFSLFAAMVFLDTWLGLLVGAKVFLS